MKKLDLDLTDKQTIDMLAITYRKTEQFDQAVYWLKKKLELDPTDKHAIDTLIIIYRKTEQFDHAIYWLKKKLEIDPTDKHAIDTLIIIYRNMGQKVSQECEQVVTQLNHDNQELKRRLAEVERKQKAQTAQLIELSNLLASNALTTTLAHEIKNPLAVIKMAAENLLEEEGLSEYWQAQLREIESHADRIAVRVEHIRELTEKPRGLWQRVSVAQVVQRAFDNFRQQLQRDKIQVKINLPPDLPEIETDPIQLEQVWVNLISNAKDALHQSGGIIQVSGQREGDKVVLRLADNGMGITPEHQARIFEPLFTTKDKKGTGVGLWLCRTIMERLHGTITFVSAVGQGTTFELTLPLQRVEDLYNE